MIPCLTSRNKKKQGGGGVVNRRRISLFTGSLETNTYTDWLSVCLTDTELRQPFGLLCSRFVGLCGASHAGWWKGGLVALELELELELELGVLFFFFFLFWWVVQRGWDRLDTNEMSLVCEIMRLLMWMEWEVSSELSSSYSVRRRSILLSTVQNTACCVWSGDSTANLQRLNWLL